MAFKRRSKFIAPTTLKSFKEVFALVRTQFSVWHWRKEVEREARVSHGKYECKLCKTIVGPRGKQIDHDVPVGSTPKLPTDLSKVTDAHLAEIGAWFLRVFCPKANLRCLCLACHKQKTAKEATERSYKGK